MLKCTVVTLKKSVDQKKKHASKLASSFGGLKRIWTIVKKLYMQKQTLE